MNSPLDPSKMIVKDSVESQVKSFYDSFGWVDTGAKSGEDRLFREFLPAYGRYHRAVEQRTEACFESCTGKLLIAGGGDMPDSHLKIAARFPDVTCLDISEKALEITKRKAGDKIHCVLGSILEAPFADETFDAVFCAHVIYHIDINLQAKAVEQLIRITKSHGRIVIIYSNPKSILLKMPRVARIIRRFARKERPVAAIASSANGPPLPFARHPLNWWRRFDDQCTVTFKPWDVVGNALEKTLFQTNWSAKVFYQGCSRVERLFPWAAARLWEYAVIILDKK